MKKMTNIFDERKGYYGGFTKVLAEDPPFGMDVYITAIYGVNKKVTVYSTQRILGHHGEGFLWNTEEWNMQ